MPDILLPTTPDIRGARLLAAVAQAIAEQPDALDAARLVLGRLAADAAEARLALPDAEGALQPVVRASGMRGDPAGRDLAAPLRCAGREVGLLEVYGGAPWLVSGGDASPLALVAAQLAPALALRAEAEARAREAARMQSLLGAGRASVSSLALKEVLSRAMESVRTLFHAAGVAIWRLDESGSVRRFGTLGLREEYVRAVTGMTPGDGILGLALREGRPVLVRDLTRDPRVRRRAELEREGLRALVCVPLLCRGRTIGALSVYYRARRVFSRADADALVGLADQVAAAIDNALLHATTERALAEASAQRQLLESVVRGAEDGILALDGAGRIRLFSPGCERLTGWPAARATGRTLAEVLACDCHPHHDPPGPGYAELHVRTPAGACRWLGVSTARVASRRAGTARTVAVLRDVTGARELDELKTAILSTVSHELRTPLTAIRALSELLAEREELPPETAQMAATINRESERLTRLVGNILDVARLQAGRLPCAPRPLDLGAVVREAVAMQEGARRGHVFEVEIAPDVPPALADPDRLRQVLDNLLDNATKHGPPGSRIAVALAPDDDDPGQVAITVADEGPGIPPGALERIFERFYHADTAAGGSGLGLHLCRGLVELMGGAISAANTERGGACFRVTLPVATRPEVT